MAAEEKKPAAGRPQNIILENRKRLSISGVEEVLSFDESEVVMRTSLGELTVHGGELHMEELAVETGALTVTGRICELDYQEPAASLWQRLFG